MAVKVDITANVSQIRDAINQVQGDILELKVNGSEVTIGGKKIKAEVKEVTNEVKNLNKEIQKTNVTTQQTVNNATKLMGRLGTQAKQAAGYVKDIATSLITPWTLIIVAVEAAAKTFTYFFNNLTENIDKMTARGNSAIKTAQRQIKQTEQQTKAVNELFKELENLNKLETLSDEQKTYGTSIINRLNKEYKIFGITLDEVTGKFEGLYQEQMKVDAHNKEVQARGLRQQISGQRQVVNAAMKEVFGSGLELGKSINGKDLFTLAERWGGNLGAENADLLAKKWGNGTNLKAIREIFAQLMGGLSDRSNAPEIQKVIDAMDQLIDYNDQLADLNSISREAMDSAKRLADAFNEQRKAIKATRDEVDKLNQQYQQNQKSEQFNSLAPKDQVKVLENEVKALEERNKAIDEAQNKNKYKAEFSKAFSDERKQMVKDNYAQQQALKEQIEARKAANDELQRQYDKAKPNYKRLAEINKQIESIEYYHYRVDTTDLRNEQAQILKQHEAAQKILDQIKANNGQNLTDQSTLDSLVNSVKEAEVAAKEYSDIAVQTEQDIANADKEQIENLLKIQEAKGKIKSLNEQIAEAEKRAAEEARKASEALWAKEDNAKKSIQDQIFSVENELLRKQGQEREALLRENIKKIEQQLGRPLQEMDQNYLKAAESMTDIQMAMKGLNEAQPQLQADKVYSNELARMGGFSSSIVVDRMDINKEILNTNKSSNQYLNTINTGIQEVNKNLQW